MSARLHYGFPLAHLMLDYWETGDPLAFHAYQSCVDERRETYHIPHVDATRERHLTTANPLLR